EALNALKQANIGLLQLNSPDSPQKLQDNIKKLSTVLNKTAEGKRLMAHVESLSSQLNTHAFAKENVAFLLTMSDNKLRLAGRGTSGDAMINLMSGAKNVADFDNYRTVTAESLLALSPTIILVVSRQQDNALSSLMAAHPSLNYTPAAKHGHLYSIAGDSLIAGLSVKAIEEVLRIQNQVRLQQADAQQ
ncbi:MAG: ABC transporter substrate-binding protein, partial [Pontibacterium sp.]